MCNDCVLQGTRIKNITSTPLSCVKTNVIIRQQLKENDPTSYFVHFKPSRRQVQALRVCMWVGVGVGVGRGGSKASGCLLQAGDGNGL